MSIRNVTILMVVFAFTLTGVYNTAYAMPVPSHEQSTIAPLLDQDGTKDPSLWAEDPRKVWLNGFSDKEQTILNAVYQIADKAAKDFGRSDGVNFAVVTGLVRLQQLEESIEFKFTYDMMAAALLLPLRQKTQAWSVIESELKRNKTIPADKRRMILETVERHMKIRSMIERLEQFNVYEISAGLITKREETKTKRKTADKDRRIEQDYYSYILQSIREAGSKDDRVRGNDLLLFLARELTHMHFYHKIDVAPTGYPVRANYDHLLYRAETIYQKICEDLMMQHFASRFKERAFEIRYKHDPELRMEADIKLKYFIAAKLSQYKNTRLFTEDGDLVFPFNHEDVRAIILRPLEKQMQEYLAQNGIKTGYRIESRAKNIGSILAKMEGRDYAKEDIGDLFGMRIIFDKIEDMHRFESLAFETFGLKSDIRQYRKEDKGVEFTNINVTTRYFGSCDFTEKEFRDYGLSVTRLLDMVTDKYPKEKRDTSKKNRNVEELNTLNTLIKFGDLAFEFHEEVSEALANKALKKKLHPELSELFASYNRDPNLFKRSNKEKMKLLNRLIVELLFKDCPRNPYFHKFEFQCMTEAEYQGYFRGKGSHNAYKSTLRKQIHDLGPARMSDNYYEDLAVILASREEYVMVILDKTDVNGVRAEMLRLREEYFPCGISILSNPSVNNDIFDPNRLEGLRIYDFKQNSYHPYPFHARAKMSGGSVVRIDNKGKGLSMLKSYDVANIINQRETLTPRSLLMLNLLHDELRKREHYKGYTVKELNARVKNSVGFGKQRLEMRQFELKSNHPDQKFIDFMCTKFNFKEPDELYAALHFQIRSTLEKYLIDEIVVERNGWHSLMKLCAHEKGFKVKRIEKKKKGGRQATVAEEIPLVPFEEFKLFLAEVEQVIPQLYYDKKIDKPHFRHLFFAIGKKKLSLETVKEYLRSMVVTDRQGHDTEESIQFLLSA